MEVSDAHAIGMVLLGVALVIGPWVGLFGPIGASQVIATSVGA